MTNPLSLNGMSARTLNLLVFAELFMILAFAIVAIASGSGFHWDFANFYDAGSKALVGQYKDLYDPNTMIAGQDPQGGLTFVSPPISSFLYAPMALFDPYSAFVIFKLQSLIATFVALFLLYRSAIQLCNFDHLSKLRFTVLFLSVTIAFQPLWTIYIVGGQTTPVVFLLFVISLICQQRSKFILSSIALGLAIVIKPGFVFAAIALFLVSPKNFAFGLTSFGAIIGSISLLIFGWEVHTDFLTVILSEAKQWQPPQFNSGIYGWLHAISTPGSERLTDNGSPWAISTVTLLIRLFIVALFINLFRRLRFEGSHTDQISVPNFLLAISFALLMMPVVWAHYLTLLLVPLTYLLALRDRLDREAIIVISLIILFSIGQNLIFVLMLEQWFGIDSTLERLVVSLVKTTPLLLTLHLLIRRSKLILNAYNSKFELTHSR